MVLGFLTPKNDQENEQLADPDLEYVWLGDVETGHYASVLGSPNYQEAVKAYARGEKMKDPPTQDPDKFINEFTPNGRAIASLIKTGFLSAQDYVVLDNSMTTLMEAKAAGGEQGLDTLLTLATPRREHFKRQLREKYDEVYNVPQNKRFKVAKLHDFQPGVQTYIWALDEAARKRQRTRMRRRTITKRRQQELRYDAYLRRGGAPFRGIRSDAETHEQVEEQIPISGKAYIEQDHLCTYWYNPTLKRWTRMIGVDTSYDNKRKEQLAAKGRTQDDEDTFDFSIGKRKQQCYGDIVAVEGNDEMFRCKDKEGNKTLRLHQQWFEHKYALPMNKGECEGLCSFSDGWVFPEGEDGIPSDIDLAFDQHGDPLATHVTCAACNTRLCRKCYFTMLKYHASHGPYLAQLVDTYYLYRTHKIEHPIDSTTYASFLNLIRQENPKALDYDEEDPALSSEEYKGNDRHTYESQQGADSQQKSQKHKKEKARQTAREQIAQQPKQKTHSHKIASSALTTPPSSDPEEWAAAVEQHERSQHERSQQERPRHLAPPPTTTKPRGGSQQTSPARGSQQASIRTIHLPRENAELEQQLRGKEIRGRFGGRRGSGQSRRPGA